jgi:hypothetical protein
MGVAARYAEFAAEFADAARAFAMRDGFEHFQALCERCFHLDCRR